MNKFGSGSKAAAFSLGRRVAVVTRAGGGSVRGLTMSHAAFEARRARGEAARVGGGRGSPSRGDRDGHLAREQLGQLGGVLLPAHDHLL